MSGNLVLKIKDPYIVYGVKDVDSVVTVATPVPEIGYNIC
jgi:hypothetical protein